MTAQLLRDGTVVQQVALTYAGETSHFAGTLSVEEAGDYELRVIAMDPEEANFGMVTRRVTIRP